MKKRICFFLVLVLLLSGCGEAPSDDPTLERNWDESFGGALKVDMDTCSETSGYRMAETERGYYTQLGGLIRYADKSDLTNWIILCDNPACAHSGDACSAYNDYCWGFSIKEDRIWMIRESFDEVSTSYMYSMNLDGTALRREYPTMTVEGYVQTYMDMYTPDYAYTAATQVLKDGSISQQIIRTNSNGSEVIYTGNGSSSNDGLWDGVLQCQLRGDGTFFPATLDITGETGCLITETGFREITAMKAADMYGGYIRGDILYHFVSNEGFFVSNLATGQSNMILEAQLTDGRGYILSEQCAVETNMYFQSEPENPCLRLYLEDQWVDVQLPEDFWADSNQGFFPVALTTEHIFFRTNTPYNKKLYCVELDGTTWELEFCASFPYVGI